GWEGGRGSRFLRHGIPARGSRRGTGSGSRARRSNRTYASLSSVPLVIVVAIPLLVTWVAIAWVPVARIGIARSRLLLRLRLLLLPPPKKPPPVCGRAGCGCASQGHLHRSNIVGTRSSRGSKDVEASSR